MSARHSATEQDLPTSAECTNGKDTKETEEEGTETEETEREKTPFGGAGLSGARASAGPSGTPCT